MTVQQKNVLKNVPKMLKAFTGGSSMAFYIETVFI